MDKHRVIFEDSNGRRAARLLQKNNNLTTAKLREKLLNKAKQLDSGILVLN